MYTFKISNKEGECIVFEHIKKASYNTIGPNGAVETVLEGENIFNHKYLTSFDLHLFSDTDAYTVSQKEISIIQVTKED